MSTVISDALPLVISILVILRNKHASTLRHLLPLAATMENLSKRKLFLIPNILSEANSAAFIPDDVREKVNGLKQFIVENEKSARALINKLKIATPQAELDIRLWNEHSKKEEMKEVTVLFDTGDVGIISEAGLPCVADPGSDIVAWAHKKNIQVIPLPGSSSIFMALMASGMNGQLFTFHGYLPIDKGQRIHKIREMCNEASKKNHAQIFMEAPYRNNHLLEDIIKNSDKKIRLCIACNISSPEEMIATKSLGEWSTMKVDLHKRPTIFIIG